ncbi:peptide/nickel transport system permease protein [Natronocella acetinitrilica]|uniref:Peptide/nickel transport system permease protein n=1 Tax=Natronocella acetinitrilica TaxID=414046 RepID=A0AAE3KEV6_9GAMM|nr:ABC transporter permease [Natronocella acetinitrilica]MCP1673507.1 peptide/nickel transport system permease protein [Natronocella acetinitrilica]
MTKIGLFLARRLVKAAIILFFIVLINFALIRAAPGDPAAVMAGEAGASDEQYVEVLRQRFGLDEPLHTQMYLYVTAVFQGDLGFSYRQGQHVSDLILDRLPATLLLTVTAFLFALAMGVLLGTLAAMKVGRWADTAITTLALVSYATPLFWLGLMLILLFSVQLGWLPSFGFESVGRGYTGLERMVDIARHMVLPVLTLGLFYMAVYTRLTRSSILEVHDMDFVKTARAKGVTEGNVMVFHVLRNAILPVITFAGFQAGHLIGGSILVETVFAWPGIGRLAFNALLQRDYQVLLGVFVVTSVLVLVFNIITDLIYTIVDPRIEVD